MKNFIKGLAGTSYQNNQTRNSCLEWHSTLFPSHPLENGNSVTCLFLMYSRIYIRSKARKIWWLWKMNVKFWSVHAVWKLSGPIQLKIKIWSLSQLDISVRDAPAPLTILVKGQLPYKPKMFQFNLQFHLSGAKSKRIKT